MGYKVRLQSVTKNRGVVTAGEKGGKNGAQAGRLQTRKAVTNRGAEFVTVTKLQSFKELVPFIKKLRSYKDF